MWGEGEGNGEPENWTVLGLWFKTRYYFETLSLLIFVLTSWSV